MDCGTGSVTWRQLEWEFLCEENAVFFSDLLHESELFDSVSIFVEEIPSASSFVEKMPSASSSSPHFSRKWWVQGLISSSNERENDINEALLRLEPALPFQMPQGIWADLEDKEWLEENQKDLAPIDLGCFYVHSHQYPPAPGKINLCLEAALAFGSGFHETTQGCLQVIEEIARRESWSNALDLGCGSGILAMAMAKIAPHSTVVACDNDPVAVRVCKENCRFNDLPDLPVLLSEGFSLLPREIGPFDLVVANILADPLCDLAPFFPDWACRHVILSGLLSCQAPRLEETFMAQNFSLLSSVTLGQWSTLLLHRPS